MFSIMGLWSTKYRKLARETFKCVIKTIQLRPCEASFEQRVKSKITAKLMFSAPLARTFYRNFRVFAWLFTLSFFISLAYSLYSVFNFVVYGSCEPGSTCYLTPVIGWCILLVERYAAYAFMIVIVLIAAYLVVKALHHR